MPELPEITVIAEQMNKGIVGKQVAGIESKQPKNLNMPVAKFAKMISEKEVSDVSGRGKWLFLKLEPGCFLLVNLGMGAELLYFKKGDKLPKKYHFKLVFSDGTGLTAHFWWFGYIHLVSEKGLAKHKMTAQLGKSPIDAAFTLEYFRGLVAKKKGAAKTFLLNQKNVAGIGNVYVQDILFRARLHPNRKLSTLCDKEVTALFRSIKEVLNSSIRLRGAAFEQDFYGKKGKFTGEHFLVGYKTGKPCPECGAKIVKVKTGSTSSYICPDCQKLETG